MSSTRRRLIEKGLGLVNPEILENHKLKEEILAYINKRVYHSTPAGNGVAILYILSDSFCKFLKKKHIDPEEFLGRRELIITDESVLFSRDFHYEPTPLEL